MGRPVFKLRHHTHQLIPVYAHKTAIGCTPRFFVTSEEAKEMLANGSASKFSTKSNSGRGKALQLTIAFEQFRGQSAQMGPRVTERAGDDSEPGCQLARAAALSYLMLRAGSYCPLVLRA
jgi:hypothetical protein